MNVLGLAKTRRRCSPGWHGPRTPWRPRGRRGARRPEIQGPRRTGRTPTAVHSDGLRALAEGADSRRPRILVQPLGLPGWALGRAAEAGHVPVCPSGCTASPVGSRCRGTLRDAGRAEPGACRRALTRGDRATPSRHHRPVGERRSAAGSRRTGPHPPKPGCCRTSRRGRAGRGDHSGSRRRRRQPIPVPRPREPGPRRARDARASPGQPRSVASCCRLRRAGPHRRCRSGSVPDQPSTEMVPDTATEAPSEPGAPAWAARVSPGQADRGHRGRAHRGSRPRQRSLSGAGGSGIPTPAGATPAGGAGDAAAGAVPASSIAAARSRMGSSLAQAMVSSMSSGGRRIRSIVRSGDLHSLPSPSP